MDEKSIGQKTNIKDKLINKTIGQQTQTKTKSDNMDPQEEQRQNFETSS